MGFLLSFVHSVAPFLRSGTSVTSRTCSHTRWAPSLERDFRRCLLGRGPTLFWSGAQECLSASLAHRLSSEVERPFEFMAWVAERSSDSETPKIESSLARVRLTARLT